MAYLVDTSILMRLANVTDAKFAEADRATAVLEQRGETLHLTVQNLIEFCNAATRPKALNGLGLTILETEAKAAIFESTFSLLKESPDIFPAWKALVNKIGVIGKTVHDARLVAVCHVHSVTHLLTFNTAHFMTMVKFGPGLIVVDPANV